MSSATLLPPNATTAERSLEAATSRLADVPVPLRSLWNADTCPAALLPWLAWGLGIDAWKDYWPEYVKRARIRAAIDIQRRKGTAESVRTVVQSFGGAVDLREWHQQQPPGVPHTFQMVLTVTGQGGAESTAGFVDDVIAEVERTKPVRSHFTFTQGLAAAAAVAVVAVARPVLYRQMQFTSS
ncbi:phage tail protein I [Pseudoxanthomonas winnipegensis]|uniref:Phage tail protein I n=1 Tax=Pseudoxanthomonas winnipegensis TaxID=2480810 RepID=A0A4Q8LCH0_9GAMM|nr:phage tail protein I [Pseudoxanthomonas winnipegensis]TAA26569.1 phage tail protein I [Pseudoxanthomonas winnipegensis]